MLLVSILRSIQVSLKLLSELAEVYFRSNVFNVIRF